MSKLRLKRKLPLIIFSVLFISMMACGYLLAGHFIFGDSGFDILGSDDDVQMPKGSVSVLLLGMDARPGETRARTDTIILANIDNEKNRISLLSIPRDTRVNIPGHGMDKINSANVYGGPELVARTVSELVGVPLKYYLCTNFYGFKDIVDVLGGVNIDVEKRMYYSSRADGPEGTIDLQPGPQRLDGTKSLQYVRYRSDGLGDITRTERQLKFLKALAQETMQAGTITKLHNLVPELRENVETNIGLKQMLSLSKAAKSFDQAELVTQTLPGHFLDLNGGSYWSVEPAQARMVARSLFEEGKVVDVVMGPTVISGSSAQGSSSQMAMTQSKPVVKGSDGETGDADTGEDARETEEGSQTGEPPAEQGNENNQADRPGNGSDQAKPPESTGGGADVMIIPAVPGADPGSGGGDEQDDQEILDKLNL